MLSLVGGPGRGAGIQLGHTGSTVAVESLEFESRKPDSGSRSARHADELRPLVEAEHPDIKARMLLP